MILIIEGQPLMKKYKISNSNRQPTRSIGVSRISTIPEIRDEQPQKKEFKHNVISLKELVQRNVERKMLNTPEPHLKRKIIIPEVSQDEFKSQITPSICKQRVIHLQLQCIILYLYMQKGNSIQNHLIFHLLHLNQVEI